MPAGTGLYRMVMLAWPVFEVNVDGGGGGMNWAVVRKGRRVGRRRVVGCMVYVGE